MKILIVDDSVDSRLILQTTLRSEGYEVLAAADGAQALEIARQTPPDMIISDILMPVMDGYQLCRLCREDERLASIPFVFYSASYTEPQDRQFGLGMGAVRFIVKPMAPDEFLRTIKGIIEEFDQGLLTPEPVAAQQGEDSFLKGYSARLIRQLEKKVEDLEAANLALRKSEADLKELFESFVRAMVNALEAKSRWTTGHSKRVASYAERIAREMGLGDDQVGELKMAALLHDIGKIGLRDSILDKPTELTREEHAIMQRHAAQGADILRDISLLHDILPAIRNHHEKPDGSGYPAGIKGHEIGLYAQIIHVADSFDSITADRPYRQAQGREQAIAELRQFTGEQFDRDMVDAFVRVLGREEEGRKRQNG